MSVLRSVVTLTISIGLAAYMFYGLPQVPRDINQPDKVFSDYLKRRLVRGLTYTGYLFGMGEIIPIGRYLHSTTYLSMAQEANFSGVQVSDEEFDGVHVRLYRPNDLMSNGPSLVWVHGGGWVWSSAGSDDFLMAELVRRLGILIVSIDYRLAPEHPFPVPFDDCAKASAYFLDNAERFDVNPSRVAIGGSSAGGNLAAAVTLKFRNEDRRRQFALQIPVVPCLQAMDFNTPSYQNNEYDGYLPKDWMINYWLWYALGFDGHKLESVVSTNAHVPHDVKKTFYQKHVSHQLVAKKYLPQNYKPVDFTSGDNKVWDKLKDVFLNQYFAPLTATDFKGMPPAYVITADLDVLRDDGIMYAKRLQKDGVSVVHQHYHHIHHSTINYYSRLEIGTKSLDDLVEFLIRRM